MSGNQIVLLKNLGIVVEWYDGGGIVRSHIKLRIGKPLFAIVATGSA